MILPDTLVAELQTFLDQRKQKDPEARDLLEKLRVLIMVANEDARKRGVKEAP